MKWTKAKRHQPEAKHKSVKCKQQQLICSSASADVPVPTTWSCKRPDAKKKHETEAGKFTESENKE